MTINMGPQHPSTHGVLRLVLELDGETIVKATPVIGYLHTGIEKTIEMKNYTQSLTMTDRADYLSPLSNNLAYSLAVEKLLGCEIPKRVQYIRVLLAELTRIASHLVWLGTHALDIGAVTIFLWCWRERERILALFEELSGVRMMTSYIRPGGLYEDLPVGWLDRVRHFAETFPAAIDEYDTMLTKNPIWVRRTKGVGYLSKEDCLAYSLTGPLLRAAGVAYDVRKAQPYSSYEEFEFDIPVFTASDVYDRYLVRMEEMRQSVRIINQALERITPPPGPYQTPDRRVARPPFADIDQSMESLIYHFKLVTEGFQVPPGEAYAAVESARGELGIFLVADGSNKPYRCRFRPPSFINLQALPAMVEGRLIADAVAVIGSIDIVLGEVDR
ncbi:MAG TPA: NADH-quinone oxidoreductase subunit D [Thermodesulfobacteriota bacterium]|nr:NADH-quinone oxidoreductase subunit D [Thermodesulfobacteriota bacterium]